MRYQLELFLTALQFFTRCPVPAGLPYSEQRLRESSAYFPAVGFAVGSVALLPVLLLPAHWQPTTRLVISTALSVLVTGAFHEDGLADACDGFGGGWNRERVLEIMKDSRLGTFGVVGLVLALALKIGLLAELPAAQLPALLIWGHGYSRFCSLTLAYRGHYAGNSTHDKPTAHGISAATLGLAAIITLAPLSLIGPIPGPALALPLLARVLLGRYFEHRIGGYTGDCLGALQVICEVLFYAGAAL